MTQNVNAEIVLELVRSLRMQLVPALSLTFGGFSQSRYVALDSFKGGITGRTNGRDGERPFFFSPESKRADVISVNPFFLRTANLAKGGHNERVLERFYSTPTF